MATLDWFWSSMASKLMASITRRCRRPLMPLLVMVMSLARPDSTTDHRALAGCSAKLGNLFLWTYGLWLALILVHLTVEHGAWCGIVFIRRQFDMWPTWDGAWLTCGMACRKSLWTMLLTNAVRESKPVWMKDKGHFEHLLQTAIFSFSAD